MQEAYSDELQNIKAKEALTQAYLSILRKFPESAEAVISFLHFLMQFTDLTNVVRYQMARIQMSNMTLEQQVSYLRFKYAFELKETERGKSAQSDS